MNRLIHFRLCGRSRSIRLVLGELAMPVDLDEELPWSWRADFIAINPSGELPVLIIDDNPPVCGVYAISEFVAEIAAGRDADLRSFSPFPGDPLERAEVRRLADWFHGKLRREVSDDLIAERVQSHLDTAHRHTPDPDRLRAVRTNLRYHLSYIDHLANQRDWLAGPSMSFADLAAAAELSISDYLGELNWDPHPNAKSWYIRMKSRPSFRALLADKLAGTTPHATYADLDF